MADNHGWGIILAFTAGTMAAMGSVSAKLAMTATVVNRLCNELVTGTFASNEDPSIICDSLSYMLRLACFGGIFLFNALMWTFFTKSLQFCSSTVEAAVTNTGANFLVTAVVGFCMFGERLSMLWWCGSCLILAGLLLIHKGSQEVEQQSRQKMK